MRRTSLLLCALATTIVGCNSSKDTPAAAKASVAAAAGKVLEVSGAVTVAGKPLAVGDSVAADATIDTGADGNVVIQLLHNLARWELGPNKHVRVDQSLAWREEKHTGPVAQVVQDSTSAGQPAERTTANTAASAVAPDEPKKDAAGSDLSGMGGLGASGQGSGGGGKLGIGSIGSIGHGGGGGTGIGAGRLAGSRGSTPTVRQEAPQVQGQLAPEVIARIVRMHNGMLRKCYEIGLAANPTLAGKITVKLIIGKDGNVMSAQPAADTLGAPKVTSCVLTAVSKWSFPAPKDGIVIATYPFVFVAD